MMLQGALAMAGEDVPVDQSGERLQFHFLAVQRGAAECQLDPLASGHRTGFGAGESPRVETGMAVEARCRAIEGGREGEFNQRPRSISSDWKVYIGTCGALAKVMLSGVRVSATWPWRR